MTDGYLRRIGTLVHEARVRRGLTVRELAERVGMTETDIDRIEAGEHDLSLEVLAALGQELEAEFVSMGHSGPQHLRIEGGRRLTGSIEVRTSKNAAVATLCASLLNKGTTTLRNLAKIEEVNRILEVLDSIGVRTEWIDGGNDLRITPPERIDLAAMDEDAAKRTRTIIMFLGPLLHEFDTFSLPYAGGCDLGTRTVEPHMIALRHFGLSVEATQGAYHASVDADRWPTKAIVLTERGDTVTENVLMAAARYEGTTIIRNASPNYMVQDLCFFLEALGVQIEGVGTTTLTVRGVREIDQDVEYSPSEDPIEAMSLLAAAVVTSSEITIERVPIEFMEIELATLETMGMEYSLSEEYLSANGRTRLVDLTHVPGPLTAPSDKIHPLPFPGLNIDNLPFFALIAATADGRTMIHDWVYENRAIYLTELTRVGGNVQLLDPHRVMISGPTRWRPAEVVCPPALRPAVVVLLAMLAAPGTSVLRNVYVINRGYEDLAERLTALGAGVSVFRDI
ncbi:UDP-N-acetylglucosamine 1-carboxyvinyltransferase [Arsenicicoccus sp. oral taxon 190]|uniref:UDP-N-acetylglucosamine 1-carboxyvinyltransferase n=1 Tax=Arsenicicoccus sp. oral taxon 190 TaxID=1658671 RepID=UPI00067A3C03|nr:UDP-N-acetylglucosamine 1-carboxyvinyltransferase [Arsenicicoccus sp. oral taxon 190]AKT52849.1 UDP-N-acetylglucosamine 1-carboxyvinyltransferase [Arsenicicoccus sp. oral taxon 190]